jgi:hypothetical protein
MGPAHPRPDQTGPHRTVPVQEFAGPVRSHSGRRKLSKKWRLVPVAALGAVLAGGVALAATGGAGIKFNVASPVTVQALGVDLSNAAVGQPVTAGAKIVAESATTLDAAVIAVRDPDGKTVDFDDVLNYKLGTSQQVFTQTKAFDKPGTYTYWFAYKKNNRWTGLNPRQTFTVGGVSTQPGGPTAEPTPSPTTDRASRRRHRRRAARPRAAAARRWRSRRRLDHASGRVGQGLPGQPVRVRPARRHQHRCPGGQVAVGHQRQLHGQRQRRPSSTARRSGAASRCGPPT